MKQVWMASVAILAISASGASAADEMVTVRPDGMKWGDGPPMLPKGYVIRIKVPAGYQIPAHWHSTAENLTVLAGIVNVGMGKKLNKNEGLALDVAMSEGLHFSQRKWTTPYGPPVLRCFR